MTEFVIFSAKKGPYFVYVDDEDAYLISKYNWYINDNGRSIYVVASVYKGRTTDSNGKRKSVYDYVSMHRLIMGLHKDDPAEVDHINGFGWDNCKANLRLATGQQNSSNLKQKRKNNTSGFKGVHFNRNANKYRARITFKQKRTLIGDFNNPIDAAKAYNEYAVRFFGEFARLNKIPFMKLDFPGVVGDIDLYMRVLRAICGETAGKSMVDLMSAFAPNTPKLGFKCRTYVDVIDRKLDHVEEQKYFVKEDVFSFMHEFSEVQELQADVAICSDGLEHLTPEDGRKFLIHMQRVSDKQIIFTPLGELWMEKIPTSDPEAHRSAWYPEMLPGWACVVFPDYHKGWGVGAFFSWKCNDIEKDFERVKNLLHDIHIR